MHHMPGLGGSDQIENLPYYEFIHHSTKLAKHLKAKEDNAKQQQSDGASQNKSFNFKNMLPKLKLPKF